jgi:dephospho-CoA kinase
LKIKKKLENKILKKNIDIKKLKNKFFENIDIKKNLENKKK